MNRKMRPLHPGAHLEEDRIALGLNKTETAKLLGISRQHLDRILKGESPITAPVAAHIAVAFGTTARIWLALQADYDLWYYRQDHEAELSQIACMA